MAPKDELIQVIERSPDELIRVLLDLVRLWQQPPLPKNADTPKAPQATLEFPKTAWTVLRTYAGSVEMPEDWAKEHDHYLYGTTKQASEP